MEQSEKWIRIFEPSASHFAVNLRELWDYRDLMWLFVRRDFVTIYKQTVLGPFWVFLPPLLMTGVFTVVFGQVARIPTDGVPPFLFYLSGNVCWGYFSTSLTHIAGSFAANASLYAKVFFPRLVIPISILIATAFKFAAQFVLFLAVWTYYLAGGGPVQPTLGLLALPLLVIMMAVLSLGCGLIVMSVTVKYRDLQHLLGFGVQVWLYLTPIVYPLSQVPEPYRTLAAVNPMVLVAEAFRLGFFGTCGLTTSDVVVGTLVTVALCVLGVFAFSRTERTFVDSV
ncbi:MAG: ABC transporter permease [Thermodesulfobacteriota bacterium]